MTAEEWRPIPGHPGYEASTEGRIRSCWVVGGAHKRGRQLGSEWRLLRGWIDAHGYRAVNVVLGDSSATRKVHALVAETFHGPRPERLQVRHLNGVQTDNRPGNLRWGTPSENQLDRVSHGTHHHANKTHCPRGHAYDYVNTYILPKSGSRVCRTCQAARRR